HLELVVLAVADGLDEKAVVGIARKDGGRAGLAALQRPFPGVEPESALDLLRVGAVAAVALVDEDRADLLLEELEALRIDGLAGNLRLVLAPGDQGQEAQENGGS